MWKKESWARWGCVVHRYAESMKGLTDGDTSAGDLVIYLGLGGNPSSPNRISQFSWTWWEFPSSPNRISQFSSPSSHCWSRSELRAKNNSFQEKSFRYMYWRGLYNVHPPRWDGIMLDPDILHPNPRWVLTLSIPECFLPSACLGLAPLRSSPSSRSSPSPHLPI